MATYSVTFHIATVNILAKANIRLLVSFRAPETQMVPQRKKRSNFQRLKRTQRTLLIIMWHK